MRFKSEKIGGYRVFAVSGTNTISFAIDASGANTEGLLGFAVERFDPGPPKEEHYFMYGFKVFKSVIPHPTEQTTVSTFDHPVQSFVWDDFTAKPDRAYRYVFHPLKGAPKNLDRNPKPIPIEVRTERLFSDEEHDIFFNRGVASSQAYARKFENKPPDKLAPEKRKEALQWLSRDLDEAMLKFIGNARKGDTLLCCFYEFRYLPVVKALAEAISKRKVNARIIVDAKQNSQDFPRKDNLAAIKAARIPKANVIMRAARPSSIQHNKFMVLLKGKSKKPAEVWTGSTNISDGGIHGQTNVGHWLRNADVAAKFRDYWDVLSKDPGAKKGERGSAAKAKNKAFSDQVESILAVPTTSNKIKKGVTPVFSPRSGLAVLKMYADMNDKANALSCITLAFGVNKEFKNLLKDNTGLDHLAFLLLEKEDKPNPKSKDPFVVINAKNNVYKAWGSFLRDPLYQWTKETNAKFLKMNKHVSYIHSKFLLVDPLGSDPIVVTGSANFSGPSTNSNDENMLLIRGSRRCADIYFTEFNRLFFHYYFRSVQEKTIGEDPAKTEESLFLRETDEWLKKYAPRSLRTKRVQALARMTGFQT